MLHAFRILISMVRTIINGSLSVFNYEITQKKIFESQFFYVFEDRIVMKVFKIANTCY